MSKIELKHVDKYYGKNHILKDVNLTIEDGDFMTLLGPSVPSTGFCSLYFCNLRSLIYK